MERSGVHLSLLFDQTLIVRIKVLSNLTNYRSFGNSKIIPRVPREAFRKVVAGSENATDCLAVWDKACNNEVLVSSFFLYVYGRLSITCTLWIRHHNSLLERDAMAISRTTTWAMFPPIRKLP